MCTVLLPPGGYPIAVKYIISNQDTVLTELQRNVKNASQDRQLLTHEMLSSQNLLKYKECTSVAEKPIIY
jgi:hypothetical protein